MSTEGEATSVIEDVKPDAAVPATAADAQPEVRQETEQETPRVFSQAEVDALIQKRLAKEQRRAEARIADAVAKATREAKPPPQRSDFASDDEHQQAQFQHAILKEAERIAEQKVAETQRKTAHESAVQAFWDKADEVSDRFPDFHSVVRDPTLPLRDHVFDFVMEAENGPEVAYWLAKNRSEADRIAAMSPVKAVLRLAQVQAELAAKPKQTISNAPAPMKPIGRGRTSDSDLPQDSDDAETWVRKERARLAKLRR